MNSQTVSNEISGLSTRTPLNFPFLTSDILQSLIETLGFKMGLSELRFCQNYFRNEKLKNPTIHELKIIDRVFYDLSKRPSTELIASFLTSNSTVADTYADLMARRRAVDPDYKKPCSVPELLGILPAFLGQEGLDALSRITLFSGNDRNTDASIARHKKIAEVGECCAAIALRKPHPNDELVVGDSVYAVLESFNECESFGEKLGALLAAQEMMTYYKRSVKVNGSIITALCNLGYGVALNTKPYEGKDGFISPFEALAESDVGVISVFNKSQAADMLIAAQEIGLRVICLGQLKNDRKIDAISASGETLSLDLNLLSSMGFSHPRRCEADGETPDITDSSSSVYISLGTQRYRMNHATCGGESYFMAGFNSVVRAHALCISSGASAVVGAGVYTLPLDKPDAKALGASIELILGAYRAQCELGLVDVCPKIEIGDKPSLCFHMLADAPVGMPMKIAAPDTRILYIESERGEGELPCFKSLRAMYGYIKKLAGEGKVTAIYPAEKDLTATLSKMLENAENAEITGAEKVTSHRDGLLLAVNAAEYGVHGVEVARILPAPETEAKEEPALDVFSSNS